MSVQQSNYEELLATYSNHKSVVSLLKQHRPYLEMLPSLRRPNDSFIALPLPLARIQNPNSQPTSSSQHAQRGELVCLPCEIAILMCDPDWKVKTGIEIFVFIHRPNEDYSALLNRWRQTQVSLDKGYEWMMPPHYQHILSEEAEVMRPLFVVFPETPERIVRGLRGAGLPHVIHSYTASTTATVPRSTSGSSLEVDSLELLDGDLDMTDSDAQDHEISESGDVHS